MINNLKSFREVWNKYLFILTKPMKKWAVVVFFLMIGGAAMETLGVSIILPLVQSILNPEVIYQYLPLVIRETFRAKVEDKQLIWIMGVTVIFIYLLKNLYLLFLSYVRTKFTCKVERELSTEMLTSYIGRGYVFLSNLSTGELLRGTTGNISNTITGIYNLMNICAEILTVSFICIYIVFSDWMLAASVVLIAAICLSCIILGFKKWTRYYGKTLYKYEARLYEIQLNIFQGIKEILVMAKQNYFIHSYRETYIKQQKGKIGSTLASESPSYIIEAFCVCGLIIGVCFKASHSENPALLVPQLAAFAVAAFRIMPSLGRISSKFNSFMTCIPGINDTYRNLYEVRLEKMSIKEINIDESESVSDWNTINAESITWAYPDSNYNVLEDLSLNISKGESIALVGTSGVGKTTLGDIFLGLLQPQKGEIFLDGINIYSLPGGWNKMIGFVPQSVYLLNDSIKTNVAFGMDESDIDENKVWKALKQAQLDEFVHNLPNGLKTMIGERGSKLSGGQSQRIAIARALYNDPDILVLDEATSALDTETETAVMEAIESLRGNKTMIIIAHRLTTIRNCDEIYRIENGKAILCNYEEL